MMSRSATVHRNKSHGTIKKDMDILSKMLQQQARFPVTEFHQDEYTHLLPFSAQELRQMGYTYVRVFADGEIWAVAPYSIENGRMFVDFYCFCSYEAALLALKTFDPAKESEPTGWHRHASTGRRRENGDPNQQTIYF
jgi:hypothetical protein